MAYTKQNFENGQILTAEQLNHMEQGISAPDWHDMTNKPFYDIEPWIPPVTLPEPGAERMKILGHMIKENTKYVVNFNGTDYECESFTHSNFPGTVYLGNIHIVLPIAGNDLPFLLMSNSNLDYEQIEVHLLDENATSCTISIRIADEPTTKRIDPKYLPVLDWNNMTNRPFGEVVGDTLAWNINMADLDLESLPGGFFTKVSDAIVTAGDLSNGCIFSAHGIIENLPVSSADIMTITEGCVALPDLMAVFVDSSAVGVDLGGELAGVVFAESGVYTVIDVISGEITIPNYGKFVSLKRIDTSYLPKTVASVAEVYIGWVDGKGMLYKDAINETPLTVNDLFDLINTSKIVVIRYDGNEVIYPVVVHAQRVEYCRGGQFFTAYAFTETGEIPQ